MGVDKSERVYERQRGKRSSWLSSQRGQGAQAQLAARAGGAGSALYERPSVVLNIYQTRYGRAIHNCFSPTNTTIDIKKDFPFGKSFCFEIIYHIR